MIGKMSDKDGPLPQDEMDGVDEEEWVSSQECALCPLLLASSHKEAHPLVKQVVIGQGRGYYTTCTLLLQMAR